MPFSLWLGVEECGKEGMLQWTKASRRRKALSDGMYSIAELSLLLCHRKDEVYLVSPTFTCPSLTWEPGTNCKTSMASAGLVSKIPREMGLSLIANAQMALCVCRVCICGLNQVGWKYFFKCTFSEHVQPPLFLSLCPVIQHIIYVAFLILLGILSYLKMSSNIQEGYTASMEILCHPIPSNYSNFTYLCAYMCLQVREQLVGVSSLLPLSGSWDWMQVSLPAEPSFHFI